MIIKPIFVDKNQLFKIFHLQITSLNINKNLTKEKILLFLFAIQQSPKSIELKIQL